MKLNIVRAWKDEEYRQTLSEEQLRTLPANPAGEFELTDADLEAVYGGRWGRNRHRGGDEHIHSFAVICDLNIFTINVLSNGLLDILTPMPHSCEFFD